MSPINSINLFAILFLNDLFVDILHVLHLINFGYEFLQTNYLRGKVNGEKGLQKYILIGRLGGCVFSVFSNSNG